MTVFIYCYLPMINLENKVAKWQPKYFYILDSFTQVWNIWPVVNYPRFDWKLNVQKAMVHVMWMVKWIQDLFSLKEEF